MKIRRQIPLRLLAFGIGLAVALPCISAQASNFALFSDRFNYSGTVTRYDTLPDAQAQTNPVGGPFTIPSFTDNNITYGGRDVSFYISKGAPSSVSSQDYNLALTSWWYTTTGPGLGSGNPNNTDTGFFQLYDDDASTWITSSAHWDPTLHTFTFSETGSDAPYETDTSRLWDAPNIGGAGVLTDGTFIDYSMGLIASFTNPATPDASHPSWYSINEEPDSITGYLTGIFHNRCSELTDPANCLIPSVDGYYYFDFVLGMNNWAYDNRNVLPSGPGLDPYNAYPTSYFAAQTPIPPALLLMASGLGMLGFAGRKRSKTETKTTA